MEREAPGDRAREAYCPVCGREADGRVRRLGEAFCSEAHADEFVREVEVLVEDGRSQDTSKRRS